jgi:hypothetical protein
VAAALAVESIGVTMNVPESVSRAELALIGIGQADAIGTHMSIYLTIVSAYLIAAYLVGRKLTSAQVTVATSIYIVAYIFEAAILAALFRSMTIAMQSYNERFSMISSFVLNVISGSNYIGVTILFAILSSSLWFMWSVRHPEKEVIDESS